MADTSLDDFFAKKDKSKKKTKSKKTDVDDVSKVKKKEKKKDKDNSGGGLNSLKPKVWFEIIIIDYVTPINWYTLLIIRI